MLVRMPDENRSFNPDDLSRNFKFATLEGRWRKTMCQFCCTYYCLRMIYYDNIYDYFQNVRQYRDVTNIGRKTILHNTYTRYIEDHESICIERCITTKFPGIENESANSNITYVSDVK